MASRGKKALKNVVIMMIYEVVAMVCSLILPRLILKTFGSTYNGIIASATQFIGYISVLTVGLAGATRVALYKAFASKDDKKVSGIVNANQQYMQKVGLVLIGYILILAIVYPFVAKTDVSYRVCFILILITGIGVFAEYFFAITAHTVLTADQSNYIYYIVMIIQTITNTIVASLLIFAGFDIVTVKIGSMLVFFITPVILKNIVTKKYHIDKKVPADKKSLEGRWDVMGHSIANIIHSDTDIVVLTIFSNVKIVSVYTVYYLVLNGLEKVMNIFTNGLEAAFGSMFANNEVDNANQNFDKYEFFIYTFASIVYACAFLLIVPFVRLYTDGVTDVNYIIPVFAFTAVLAQLFKCIRKPYLTIVQAAGHYKQTKRGAYLEAMINIVLSISLTFKFGIVGVTVGTLAANVFRTFQYMFYIRNNILNRSISKSFRMLIWLSINLTITLVTGKYFIDYIMINSWIRWVLAGVCVFVYTIIITCITGIIFNRTIMIKTTRSIMNMMPFIRSKR